MADNPTVAPEGSNEAIITISGEANDAGRKRRDSENSQTAAEFLRDQMQLEADAREALPYVRHTHSPCSPTLCLQCHSDLT